MRRRLRGGVVAAGAVGCVLALPAVAADWVYVPRVGLSAGYDSNTYLSPDNERGNALGILDASSAIQATTERSLVRIDPAVHVYRNTDQKDLDRVDAGLNARFDTHSERRSWDATFGYLHDTTLTSELGDTGVTSVRKYRDHVDGSLSPTFRLTERGSLVLAVSGQYNDYHDAIQDGLYDYSYSTATLGWAHQASERAQWAFQVQGGTMSVPDRSDAETSNAVASFRYRYNWSELTSITLIMGPSYAKSDIDKKWGGDGSLTWVTSNERRNWSLSLGRRFQPSGFGVLNNRDFLEAAFGYRLTERWRSSTSATVYRSTRAVSVVATGTVTNSAASDNNYRVSYAALSQNLAWQITQTLSISLTAGGALQRTNLAENETAERYNASLGLIWQPRADL